MATEMIWKKPTHICRVFEALTAVADERISITGKTLVGTTTACCYSTSGNKYYELEFDPASKAIMSNDNAAYFTGTLSYPMIALLMLLNVMPYDNKLLPHLKGIFWKEINQRHQNNYDESIEEVLNELRTKKVDTDWIVHEVTDMFSAACAMKLSHLGKLRTPPKAY